MAQTNATITIQLKDIYYDVDAATHLFSRAQAGSLPAEQADNISSDSTDETFDKSVLKRYADVADAEVRKILWKILQRPATAIVSGSNALDVTAGYYTYTLTLSSRRVVNKIQPLSQAIHSYIVNVVLRNYYIAVGQGAAAETAAAKVQLAEQDLKNIAFVRIEPTYS